MMHTVSLILIVSGGFLTSYAGLKYNRLLKGSKDYNELLPSYAGAIRAASRGMLIFFIIGFFVGAFDMIFREVEPIYHFVVLVFFVAAVFFFLLIQNLALLAGALEEKNKLLSDAFGQIEAHNRELRSEVDLRVREIVAQDKLLHTVNDVAGLLLASTPDMFESAMLNCMEMLGRCVEVDRVFVWKTDPDSDEMSSTQVYAWVDPASPQSAADMPGETVYNGMMPEWRDILLSGRCVKGLAREMGRGEREALEARGLVSILIEPVFLQDGYWGVVCFGDSAKERDFAESEEGILHSASLLIATSMQRNEMIRSLVDAREEALSSTRAKSLFLSNMSHEIRTPINAITGMVTIARKAAEMGEVHDCLAKIDAASRQLLALINDVLDMSKIEAEKMELACEPFDLRQAFENIRSIIEVRAKEKHQRFSVAISPEVPDAVYGDEMRLSQVLLNLLSNAVKFTPERGEVSLSLKVVSADGDACTFEASVRDTGIGISQEQKERLFQAFEQADRSTARRFGGTGLGLVISKRITEMMGGGIEVTSTPGAGSRFTARFVMKRSDAPLTQRQPEGALTDDLDFTGLVALLAEDIEINLEIAVSFLEDKGMTVDCAEDGRRALEAFSADPDRYAMIFMDVHMPIMDGYEATEAIRALDIPRAREIPIIAMTANAFAEDVKRCLDHGMNDHIAKPIDVERLYRLVERYARKG